MLDHDIVVTDQTIRVMIQVQSIPDTWRRILVLPENGQIDHFTDEGGLSPDIAKFIEENSASRSWRFLTRTPDNAELCVPGNWVNQFPDGVYLGVIIDNTDEVGPLAAAAWWVAGDNYYLHISRRTQENPDPVDITIVDLGDDEVRWVTAPAGALAPASLQYCQDHSIPVYLLENEE